MCGDGGGGGALMIHDAWRTVVDIDRRNKLRYASLQRRDGETLEGHNPPIACISGRTEKGFQQRAQAAGERGGGGGLTVSLYGHETFY